MTRPVKKLAKDYPGTVPSMNAAGWCDPCRRRVNNVPPKHQTATARVYVKDPVVMQKRVDELVAWRARFERSRRARGIPAEGILFPGETASEPQVARPVEAPPSPATVKKRPLCKNGHEFDMVDLAGRRRCSICMRENSSNTRKALQPQPTEGAPNGVCKHGHPYILDRNGKKLCRECRNGQKRRWRERKRQEEADEIVAALRQAS